MKSPTLLLALMTCFFILPVHASGWFGKSDAELQAEQQAADEKAAAESRKNAGFWNKFMNTFGRKNVQAENSGQKAVEEGQATKAESGVWAKILGRAAKQKEVNPEAAQVDVQKQTPVDQPQKAGFFASLFRRTPKVVDAPVEEPKMDDIQIEQSSKGWFSWGRSKSHVSTAGNGEGAQEQGIPGTNSVTLVGELPNTFKFIIGELQGYGSVKAKSKDQKAGLFVNRLLLYGPPGNGKSTWASEIAKRGKCEFVERKGSTIVGRYIGEGSDRIVEVFKEAYDKVQKTDRPVVLFIDEFDAFTSKKFDNSKMSGDQEFANAAKTLWMYMDEVRRKGLPIVVVLATNLQLKDLDDRVRNRFNASAVVEIKNPDQKQRAEVLSLYLGKNLPKGARERLFADTSFMKKLASYSDKMSIRQIELFTEDCRMMCKPGEPDAEVLTKAEILRLLAENKAKVSADLETRAEKIERKYKTEFEVAGHAHNVYSLTHSILNAPLNVVNLFRGYRDLWLGR